ncbi:glycosyl transferase family 1 [Neisseria meningitidis]|nr:glycosyl transferase family 1 [Neisseria meningitidis]
MFRRLFLISGRYYSGLTKIRTRRRSRRQYR